MTQQLPKHILTALKNNHTSLGDHPSFPPEEEEKFVINIVNKTFNSLSEKVAIDNVDELKRQVNQLLTECKKIEAKNITNLEELCIKIITELFQIPEDTIDLDVKIVNKVESAEERLIPEKTEDYSFEDINDMNNLTDEVYKRRMLNALVTGASMYYTNNIGNYIKEIFNIDSDLPSLYKKLLDYNNILMYYEKDRIDPKQTTNGGKVDVSISSEDNIPVIKSEGVIFPILVEETIKGILELSISHGLPKNLAKAKYVMGKSDFKLAELWDMRLGYALWKLIADMVEKSGYDLLDIGINFFLMILSQMNCEEFNSTLQEVFARTKKGQECLTNLIENIIYLKEQDEFDDYITTQNNNFKINDDEYFTSEELLNDDYQY